MGELRNALETYAAKGLRSFHTPGHKGMGMNRDQYCKASREGFTNGCRLDLDLTELPGLDDLHAPTGILKDAQDRAAALYGADHAFYLVNGSTAGVLAMLSACVPEGAEIIMQKDSHRSAHNAVMLRHLQPVYIEPEREPRSGAAYGVSLTAVESMLSAYPEVQAVFLTSPNYEGFSADLQTIAELVHGQNKLLLVDAAHGAHFGFDKYHPPSAIQCGADAAVVSLHKTLPSPTQTALLLMQGERVSKAAFQEWLGVYQTTSPSYLLMAAMDDCIDYVSKLTEKDWEDYHTWRLEFADTLRDLADRERFSVFSQNPEVYADRERDSACDPGKILLLPKDGRSGLQLADELRRHGWEPEFALPGYCLLITTIMDRNQPLFNSKNPNETSPG